jgi:hypothetical protein
MNNTKKHRLTYNVPVHDYSTPTCNPRITGEHFPRYTYVTTCTALHISCNVQCSLQSLLLTICECVGCFLFFVVYPYVCAYTRKGVAMYTFVYNTDPQDEDVQAYTWCVQCILYEYKKRTHIRKIT